MPFRVLLDACVLVPYHLSDLLLRLGEAELFDPLWSADILEEVRRHVPTGAQGRVDRMARAFPLAPVEGYEGLIPAMGTQEKDRHVLAAAVRGGAALIVTANLKDFPDAALRPYGIEAIHPDEFLLDQLDLHATRVRQVLTDQRAGYTRPELSIEEFYRTLAVNVPAFAAAAASAAVAAFGPDTPLPLEIVDPGVAAAAFFPDGAPTPMTPRGAAYLWWSALLHRDEAGEAEVLRYLSYRPADWGDYNQTASSLEGWAMMQFVEPCADAPEDIAYAKFVPDPGHSVRSFGDAPLPDVQILTVIRLPDGLWQAWGLSDNHYRPSAARVHGTEKH